MSSPSEGHGGEVEQTAELYDSLCSAGRSCSRKGDHVAKAPSTTRWKHLVKTERFSVSSIYLKSTLQVRQEILPPGVKLKMPY